MIATSPFAKTSQAQPDPKRPVAAVLNASWKSANEPNLASIASFKAPVGSPPAFAANCSQNNVWLACPPTLLRTAVFLSSGTASKLDKISSADLSAKSVPSKAAFAFVT